MFRKQNLDINKQQKNECLMFVSDNVSLCIFHHTTVLDYIKVQCWGQMDSIEQMQNKKY